MKVRLIFLFLLTLVLSSCASDSKREKQSIAAADVLYGKGRAYLQRKDYKEAYAYFNDIAVVHPFSKIAPDAKLMMAYVSYLRGNFNDTISILHSYIDSNDYHLDYAYYMLARAMYSQVARGNRDLSLYKNTRDTLVLLMRKYPKSRYYQDAKERLMLVDEAIAEKVFKIGEFYFNREEYRGAGNRMLDIVKNYSSTSYASKAFYYLISSELKRTDGKAERLFESHRFRVNKDRWFKRTEELLEGALKSA